MTRLILDYYRRWGRVLAIGAVPPLIMGWWITVEPKTPIEFIVALLPVWLLHLFDLSRGAVRVLLTLPLTARQIGRSWWFANVFIPAIMVAALLFLGAGAAVLWHPYQAWWSPPPRRPSPIRRPYPFQSLRQKAATCR